MQKQLFLVTMLIVFLFSVGCDKTEKPARQTALDTIINATYEQYDKASTDYQKKEAIEARHSATKAFLAEDNIFTKWVFKVEEVRTKGGENDLFTKQEIALLEIKKDRITLNNMDTAIDGLPKGAIVKSTNLFDTIVGLSKGSEIIASGHFVPDVENNLREISMTDAGMMSNPEFVVIFTDIETVK